jgi:hypothetical protein
MKVFIWNQGLEIVNDIRGMNQAIQEAEVRGVAAFELLPKQGRKREYRKDAQSGKWYRA